MSETHTTDTVRSASQARKYVDVCSICASAELYDMPHEHDAADLYDAADRHRARADRLEVEANEIRRDAANHGRSRMGADLAVAADKMSAQVAQLRTWADELDEEGAEQAGADAMTLDELRPALDAIWAEHGLSRPVTHHVDVPSVGGASGRRVEFKRVGNRWVGSTHVFLNGADLGTLPHYRTSLGYNHDMLRSARETVAMILQAEVSPDERRWYESQG